MKKVFLFLIIMAVVLSGCSLKQPAASDSNTENIENEDRGDNMSDKTDLKANSHKEKALYMYDKVYELYNVPGTEFFLERYPAQPEDKAVSYLWPFSGMFSAVNALGAIIDPEDYQKKLDRIMAGLEKYYDSLREPPAYQAYPFDFGGDDRFYDDNQWLGLDFLEAYHLTKDEKYLEKAKMMFDFSISGWSDELGGGIYWCEQKLDTKNTCSNGPAAVLALKLYEVTKEESYLEWGKKIYEWTRSNLQDPSCVYWDHLRTDGGIDRTTYTYNTGTMLHSAVLLYKVTGEQEYLLEAERVAKASLDHFAPVRSDGKRFFPKENPWFTGVLFRGYICLYEVNKDPTYIDAVIENIDYAWENARDANGLISRDWSGESKEDANVKWLLDEACLVELYARAHLLRSGNNAE